MAAKMRESVLHKLVLVGITALVDKRHILYTIPYFILP